MKLRKQHSLCRKGVDIRCVNIAAVDAEIGVSQIVRDEQKNVRAIIGLADGRGVIFGVTTAC